MAAFGTLTAEERELWSLFNSMRGHLDRALDAKMQQESTVTASECKVLVVIDEARARSLGVTGIAHTLAWEKSRVSHLVSRMESRGLVAKVRQHDDNRAWRVTLTHAGERVLIGAVRGRDTAAQRYFFDQLNAGDAAVVAELSKRVLKSLGREVIAPPG
ncbi:MAG: hypothetical protein JWO10_1785 [Microbacteriaceae bacterium]|nr:hypothetical protein [Microbacteriaceae bacterium]